MTATAAGQTWSETSDTSSLADEGDFNQSSGSDGALVDDDMNIDMAVTSTVQLDVKPGALNYVAMDVGSRQVNSERNFTSLNLQNTGSEYIDTVWIDTSTPNSDPFRTGQSTNNVTDDGSAAHDAGNFMQIRPVDPSDSNLSASMNNPAGDNDAFHAINRKEFAIGAYDSSGGNENGQTGQIPNFINADPQEMELIDFANSDFSSGQNPMVATGNDNWGETNAIEQSTTPTEVHVGSFRVANRDYYYALLLGDDSGSQSGELRVADATFADNIGKDTDGWDAYDPSDLGSGKNVAWHDGDTFGAYDFTDGGANNEPVRYRVYDLQSISQTSVGLISGLELRADESVLNFPETSPPSNDVNRTYDVVVSRRGGPDSGNIATLTRTTFNPLPGPLQGNGNNQDLVSVSAASNTQYLFNEEGSTYDNMLRPGESIAAQLGIEVPRGVVQGQVETGTLTVLLTSDNRATPGEDAEEFIHTDQ